MNSPAARAAVQPPLAPLASAQPIESYSKSPTAGTSKSPTPIGASPLAPAAGGGAPAVGQARAAETATSVESDVLETRLAATEKWLATGPNDLYSIQLLGTPDAAQLRLHLNELSKFIEMNKIFVYRTVANGRPLLTVLYGSFSDRRSAQEVLEKLPESLRANRPILRTVEGIRAELKRHQAS